MSEPQKRERPAGTRANAEESTSSAIVGHASLDRKTVDTLRARAALAGYELSVAQNMDGRTICTFARHGRARVFSHPHDVQAFLAQVGDGK